MKYLKPFRLAFVLALFAIFITFAQSSYVLFTGIDSVVTNHTGEAWRFGFTSLVKSHGKEVLFPGEKSNFPIEAGASQPWGHGEQSRLLAIYLENGSKKLEIPCPAGFAHYGVDIQEVPVCRGTNNKISRWLATAPYAPLIMGAYLRNWSELFTFSRT